MENYEFSGMYYGKYITVKRISKKTARKMFEQGKTIYIQSCRFHPFGVWSQMIDINKENDSFSYGTYNFDMYVNSFEYYNCSFEQGYYASFYIELTN